MNELAHSDANEIVENIKVIVGPDALPEKWKEPLVKLRDRHSARVISLSMNHDETLILSGGEDNTIMLVNIETKDIHTFDEHLHPVCCVAFQTNNYAVSIGMDSSIIIWDLKRRAYLMIRFSATTTSI